MALDRLFSHDMLTWITIFCCNNDEKRNDEVRVMKQRNRGARTGVHAQDRRKDMKDAVVAKLTFIAYCQDLRVPAELRWGWGKRAAIGSGWRTDCGSERLFAGARNQERSCEEAAMDFRSTRVE
jgi:hypothetical protein